MREIEIGEPQKTILEFPDGTFLYQCRGNFDGFMFKYENWALRDRDYFSMLQELVKKYSVDKIYKDFVSVYNIVKKDIHKEDWKKIRKIASQYDLNDMLVVGKLYCILYVTMLAEQNNHHSILGKRIKRLAVYQLLILGMSLDEVVNFSKGKSARSYLEPLCERYGF